MVKLGGNSIFGHSTILRIIVSELRRTYHLSQHWELLGVNAGTLPEQWHGFLLVGANALSRPWAQTPQPVQNTQR